MNQLVYVSSDKLLSIHASFSSARFACMTLARLAHTRLDFLLEVFQLAQVAESIFDTNPEKEINVLNYTQKIRA